MTFELALQLLLTYGPSALAQGQKLVAEIKAGRGQQELTDADWSELSRLSGLTSASILASVGVTLPTK